MYGYHGNYRKIDARTGESEFQPLRESDLRHFLGGSGLGTFLMLKEGSDSLPAGSPESPLAFVFSPLVGSPLTTSAKFAVVSKSPLTDRINDSLASSSFAIQGKKSGSDAIVIVGRASEPSILVIDDQSSRLEPAGDVWGTTCSRAEQILRERYPDFALAVIGPAGENEVPFSTISHDGRHAGRGGSGAVLGAKNIKALAVRGTQVSHWANPKELAQLSKELSSRSLGPATAKYRELGTASNLLLFNRLNALPTRNFQAGSFEGVSELSPEELAETRQKTRAYCAACTIGCEHIYSIQDDESAGPQQVRIEYENLFALGPLCGIHDSEVVLRASKLCDEMGLDTISAGGTIAFAMECVERDWLAAKWLRFGDGDALLRAIREIAQRQGLGARLAAGSRRLAESIGEDAVAIAPQVKGLELPGYEPRALQTMALGLAVGTRGADHNRSTAYEADFSVSSHRRRLTAESADDAIASEDRAALIDSMIFCKFLRGVFRDFYRESATILNLVTGWSVDAKELQHTASRIVSARKLFNIRAGWGPEEDTLPSRFLELSLPDDPQASLSRSELHNAITAYNRQRGWTSEGWIADTMLQELGLDQI